MLPIESGALERVAARASHADLGRFVGEILDDATRISTRLGYEHRTAADVMAAGSAASRLVERLGSSDIRNALIELDVVPAVKLSRSRSWFAGFAKAVEVNSGHISPHLDAQASVRIAQLRRSAADVTAALLR